MTTRSTTAQQRREPEVRYPLNSRQRRCTGTRAMDAGQRVDTVKRELLVANILITRLGKPLDFVDSAGIRSRSNNTSPLFW